MKFDILYSVLKELQPYKMNIIKNYNKDLDSRIIVQKIIYILQELNDFQDFRFSFYSNGPYSYELNLDMYSKVLTLSNETMLLIDDKFTFNEKGLESINKVKDFFNFDFDTFTGLSLSDIYELSTSIYYINKREDSSIDRLVDVVYKNTNYNIRDIKRMTLLTKDYLYFKEDLC